MFKLNCFCIVAVYIIISSWLIASDKNQGVNKQDTSNLASYVKVGDQKEFPKAIDKDKWELVWEDEFTGDKIDDTKWVHCPEWSRCDGFCKWNDKDAYVDGNGNLILRIRKENDKIYCGAVRTKDIYEKKFGYFEISCKVPVIPGGWGAFWMMPTAGNNAGDEGRDGTEIDIFESIFSDRNKANHALHWDGYGKEHKSTSHVIDNASYLYTGYHKYGLLWNEKEYVFYVDDKETWRTSDGGVMQVPGYLKITMEAAKWAGNIHKEQLPKHMTVEYVRVYSKKDSKN